MYCKHKKVFFYLLTDKWWSYFEILKYAYLYGLCTAPICLQFGRRQFVPWIKVAFAWKLSWRMKSTYLLGEQLNVEEHVFTGRYHVKFFGSQHYFTHGVWVGANYDNCGQFIKLRDLFIIIMNYLYSERLLSVSIHTEYGVKP